MCYEGKMKKNAFRHAPEGYPLRKDGGSRPQILARTSVLYLCLYGVHLCEHIAPYPDLNL